MWTPTIWNMCSFGRGITLLNCTNATFSYDVRYSTLYRTFEWLPDEPTTWLKALSEYLWFVTFQPFLLWIYLSVPDLLVFWNMYISLSLTLINVYNFSRHAELEAYFPKWRSSALSAYVHVLWHKTNSLRQIINFSSVILS